MEIMANETSLTMPDANCSFFYLHPSDGVGHGTKSPDTEETDGRMGGSAFSENGNDSRQLYPQSPSVLPPMSTTTMMTSSPPPDQLSPESRSITSTSPKRDKTSVADEEDETIKVDEDEDEKDSSIAQQGSSDILSYSTNVDIF